MPLNQGQIVNSRYRIVRLLGQGGFGAVYRAWDLNLSKACAVKENLDVSPEAQRQFTREATVLSNLSHPNMPRVTDHFILGEMGQYLVMDYVEGEDLETMIQEKGLIPAEQALNWVGQVAEALVYLHTQNPPVLHRDIKPANIRITPQGRAMLVDFGLVKLYNPQLRTTLGARAVTPGFAPPEQYGQGTTDVRTDVYALGATLYMMVTGEAPQESIQRVSNDTLIAPDVINPDISGEVSRAIRKAMALSPSQRYQSVQEFKGVLGGGGVGKKEEMAGEGELPVATVMVEGVMGGGVPVATMKAEAVGVGNYGPGTRVVEPAGVSGLEGQGKKGSRKGLVWGLVGGGIIGICMLTVALLVIGSQISAQNNHTTATAQAIALASVQAEQTRVMANIAATATAQAIPTDTAQPPTSIPVPVSTPTTYFHDDFSNQNSGWKISSEDTADFGYENGSYFILEKQKGYFTWSVVPADFEPTDIEVTASIPADFKNKVPGYLGVMCDIVDNDNFYHIEFDPSNNSFLIRKWVQGNDQKITSDWQDSKNINRGKSDPVKLKVSCPGNGISLWINDQFQGEFTDNTFTSGKMAILTGVFDDPADPAGFKVSFSNLTAFRPVQ